MLEDVLRDLDVFTLRAADHTVTLIIDRVVVTRAREPVADRELCLVPLRSILLLFIFIIHLLGTLLEDVFDVLEDDVFDGAMIDLSELVWALGGEVNHQAPTQIVLHLDHVASHDAVLPLQQVFRELAKLALV